MAPIDARILTTEELAKLGQAGEPDSKFVETGTLTFKGEKGILTKDTHGTRDGKKHNTVALALDENRVEEAKRLLGLK